MGQPSSRDDLEATLMHNRLHFGVSLFHERVRTATVYQLHLSDKQAFHS